MGADVIKVEPPGTGDQTRHSMGDAAVSRRQPQQALDHAQPQGRRGSRTFHKLVETADVVTENYRPGVAARLGADYETLRAINPRLIHASISGFGQTGPYAQRPGYDLIAQGVPAS